MSGLSRRALHILVTCILILMAGAAFTQAFLQYASEVTASEADQQTTRKMHAQARELAETSIRYNPYNGYAYYYLGYLELLLERYQEAIQVFEAGRPYMPHLTQLLKMLAQAYYFAGEFNKAVATFDTYLAMDPQPRVGADNIFRLWAEALSRTRDFGRATIALARADSFDTYRDELLQTRILNAILLNQTLMADYYYRAFKFAFPEKTLEPTALFSAALAANRMDTLIRFLELNRLRGQMDATTEKILAMGYAKQGRLHEAVVVLTTAERISPEDPELPLFLGDALFQLGEREKALEQYERHLKLAPQSPFRKDLLRRFPELEQRVGPAKPPLAGAEDNVTSAPAQLP